MDSDNEDTELKIYWGECNDFLLEQWIESKKTIFNYVVDDYKPLSVDVPDKPWMIPGADVSDWFNFGFNEDTWNNFLMRQISLRQQKIYEKEQQTQQEHLKSQELNQDSRDRVKRKDYKHDDNKKLRR
ncbi:hypothetical protein SteCoe_28950 [Stentor coeruleus]|uniref:Pre-mRNA polyadenylation factor Fip1 domain-containing protein n=1 Tax=Stentor coeruleus TaxID=5963 RepID=A0A1R2B6X7_9CILI|nr:hypothetical protein SteCoe_28950 [Stentor coeruleus]